MPFAGRKRVEGGGLPILSQSVAIGRDWSRLVAPKQKTRRRKKSRLVAIGRDWSRLVAIGRDWSRLVAPKQKTRRRRSRDWSRLVAPKQKTRRRKSRDWSRLVAIGRNRSRLVAPKQKTRRKHKKSPIPQSGIGLHNVARRRALLAFNELLAQIHVQALEAFC